MVARWSSTIFSILYRLVHWLDLTAMLLRRDLSKDAELLVTNLADHQIRRRAILDGLTQRVSNRSITATGYPKSPQVKHRILYPSPTG